MIKTYNLLCNFSFFSPIGYKVIRYYWSLTEANKRAPYTCTIVENKETNKPEFQVTSTVFDEDKKEVEKTFVDTTARGVWHQILVLLEKMRRENNMVKVFPR